MIREARRSTLFADQIEALGASVETRGPWAVVGDAGRTQGWKLHLSTVPGEAAALVKIVVPVLVERAVSFKIARDGYVLSQLNEGALGPTQVGKFITVYPPDDSAARELVDQLNQITEGFRGPVVPTDLRLGDVVYARYGAFDPIVSRDRLGQLQLSIRDADGRLTPDDYAVPFEAPPGISNPFAPMPADSATTNGNGSRLFGPGYLLLDVVKQQAKGAVFQALDLRHQETAAAKIIKQGRAHCLEDELGRDMRYRLQRQERVHNLLASELPVPAADPYFELSGDGYLPLELIHGSSVETVARATIAERPWRAVPNRQRRRLMLHFHELVRWVSKMHDLGWVHRDLTASNVWIADDGGICLLDLELAHALNDSTPPLGLGTPGFMSPQQRAREEATTADDVYALACILLLLVTGQDPRRFPRFSGPALARHLGGLGGDLPKTICSAAARALTSDQEERLAITQLEGAVERYLHALDGQLRLKPERGRVLGRRRLQDLVRAAANGLLTQTLRDEGTGLWLSPALDSGHGGGQQSGAFELRRSASRGVAGVVYALAQLARSGYAPAQAAKEVDGAVAWLLSSEPSPDDGLPGLHFGRAGVALAACEAARSRMVEASTAMAAATTALEGELDWPDITHGAAGQGIAALRCGDILGAPELAGFAGACADYLIDAQLPDGCWQMPPGVDGMSGEVLTGFAHGAAGISYFLIEYAKRVDDRRTAGAGRRGLDWLASTARRDRRGRLNWPYSATNSDEWRWWCHGAPGIALAFLHAYEATGEAEYAAIADAALGSLPAELRSGNLSQCHGLSGLGEIFLEAWRVLGAPRWRHRARAIARALANLDFASPEGTVWIVEHPDVATADLMVGSGGVAHFLLRLSVGPDALGLPLLMEPKPWRAPGVT